MNKDNPEEVLWLENQLCFPLYAASRMVTKLYTPLLNELGITYPQYLVLLVLWKDKAMTVSELTNKLYLESNTLTPLLKRMETKGLITRVRQKEDERKVKINLTNKAEAMKEKALCIPQKIMDQVHSEAIPHENILNFKKTLDKMIDLLSKNNEALG